MRKMAKTRRQFSGAVFFCVVFFFVVMGCQNGFDLLWDLLIINCIICFLLGLSQEKSQPQLFIRGRGTIRAIREGRWTEAGGAGCQQMVAKSTQLPAQALKGNRKLASLPRCGGHN